MSALLVNNSHTKAWNAVGAALLFVACVGLSGCGMVVSTKPLFDPQAVGNLQPRPGLWALAEPDCHFNTSAPPANWPGCVQALSIRDGVAVNARPQGQGELLDQPVAFTMAGGSPGVIQIARPISKDFSRWGHGYYGYRPLASDGEGRVVSARVWPAFCARPAPGRPLGKDCWTPSAEEVRLALKDSEIWAYEDRLSDLGLKAVWVRYEGGR